MFLDGAINDVSLWTSTTKVFTVDTQLSKSSKGDRLRSIPLYYAQDNLSTSQISIEQQASSVDSTGELAFA